MVDFARPVNSSIDKNNVATNFHSQLTIASTLDLHIQQTLSNSEGLSLTYFHHYVAPIARIVLANDETEKWYILDEVKTWKEINPQQLWFWTNEWQQQERQADEDLIQGRYEDFDNLDDLFDV